MRSLPVRELSCCWGLTDRLDCRCRWFGIYQAAVFRFIQRHSRAIPAGNGVNHCIKIGALRRYGVFLIFFGIGMPLFSALVGTGLGLLLGLSVGGTAMLATLAASASYIAVPAAMRISVPDANPTLSLAASLGITFPFNVLIGIAVYYELAVSSHAFFGG